MTEEQRALLFNVVNSARAVTNTTGNGPFNTLLRTPQVGELSQQLGNAIRFSSGLSGRLREMATLMAGPRLDVDATSGTRTRAMRSMKASTRRSSRRSRSIARRISLRCRSRTRWSGASPTRSCTRAALRTQRTRKRSPCSASGGCSARSTIAAYYEYVSMLLNVDRYPLPADAPAEAAAAAHALVPLTAAERYRPPQGAVTPRPRIRNENIDSALDALGAQVRDASVSDEPSTDAVRSGDARSKPCCGQWTRRRHRQRGACAAARRGHGGSRFAAELLDTRFVSDATFAAALEAFGERGLVNLMVLMGHSNIRCAQQALAGAALRTLITTRRTSR